ncbi:hypothetical protein Clacol_004709 [Clathrus columnatus]|uniref:DUF1279 domain-containing protein n=1 Tax=Clathrus columnatus TaxID=1419009 RepID=A0AAV5ACW2_9AGAM|nr:hypothetical protein Clacol_004709 [Clathrus columnatus]
MINILKRNFPKSSRIILRRTQSTQPQPLNTGPEKPFTLRSRPFLFAGTFIGLYQAIAAGTSLLAFLYFRYTDSSTLFLGGPTATYLLRLHLPFTNGQRTIGDMLDTALRRAMATNWSPAPWIRRIKQKRTNHEEEERQEDPEVIERVLDQLEGSDGSRRQKDDLSETKPMAVSADSSERAGRFGGWRDKQVDRLRAARGRIPDQDELRRTAGEWKDKIKTVSVTGAIEPQQGTLKKLTDAAAAYVVLKALFPVRLGAALVFTPRVAKWVVAVWRRIF